MVPILKQGPYLIAVIQSELTDADLLRLYDSLAEQVGKLHPRGVIVDVKGLDVMDSFATRTLHSIAQVVRLRGAEAVIAGIQPEVAFTMVQLGLDLKLAGVETVLDMEEGIALLEQRITRRYNHGG